MWLLGGGGASYVRRPFDFVGRRANRRGFAPLRSAGMGQEDQFLREINCPIILAAVSPVQVTSDQLWGWHPTGSLRTRRSANGPSSGGSQLISLIAQIPRRRGAGDPIQCYPDRTYLQDRLVSAVVAQHLQRDADEYVPQVIHDLNYFC